MDKPNPTEFEGFSISLPSHRQRYWDMRSSRRNAGRNRQEQGFFETANPHASRPYYFTYIAEDVVLSNYFAESCGWTGITDGCRAAQRTLSRAPVEEKGNFMTRQYIDCREHPQEGSKKCTVAISADSVDEVVEAAVDHVVKVHAYEDTPEVRKQMQAAVKKGSPRP
jgi:predicted small metal-binding protein